MTGAGVVRAGFIPLVDCAPLVAAARAGFADTEGLRIDLVRETSWASVRDRVAVRHIDIAHMLGPVPIAAGLGLAPLPVQLVVPIALGHGGNTVTVSSALYRELEDHGAGADLDPRTAGEAFARLVAARRTAGRARPVLAIVHTHSAHYYQLAYWLAAAGVHPLTDVELVVVPPPLMADALADGHVDGFSVGEPWGSVAASAGHGVILTTNAHIWRASPDKVIGLRSAYAVEDPDRLDRIVRAVFRAAVWCDDPANRPDLANLLAAPDVLNRPVAEIAQCLAHEVPRPGGGTARVDGFLTFARAAASFPWISQAAWFYAQMVRWGQVAYSPDTLAKARATYRPDLFRRAVGPLGVALPAANEKVEGALAAATPAGSTGSLTLPPDGFFDGRHFDPSDVAGYLAGLHIRSDSALARRTE